METDEKKILFYGTLWCGSSRSSRNYLDLHHIAYQWVDIDEDPDGEAYVIKVNKGFRSVPTLVFPDGDVLVEPNREALAKKLGLN